jgi:DNA-binding NtrC family response regulator
VTDDHSATTRCVTGSQVGVADGAARLARHRHRIRVVAGPDRGATKQIERTTIRIGTAESCDVCLRDDTVSRQHAELSVRGLTYVLRDLGSTNGTRINGVSIDTAYLEPGAHIAVGETELRFDSESSWVAVRLSSSDELGELYGRSSIMRAVFGVLERIAKTDLTCLLTGETGTGKDAAARALHALSDRREHPFVVLDCAALSGELADSEIFGHRRGAFTGADQSRAGAFERAHGGTVFLDEIGELPLDLQPKLLRVLERGEVRRLGDTVPITADARVVAATHRDLGAMVEAGTFREDLYHRLAEVNVHLPSLADRFEDLPELAARLLRSVAPSREVRLTRDAIDYLVLRPWPGNVRELRNVLRRTAAFHPGATIDRGALLAAERSIEPVTSGTDVVPVAVRADLPVGAARDHWIATLEKRYMEEVYAQHGGDLDAIAEHISLHRKSVFRLLRRHGILEEPS